MVIIPSRCCWNQAILGVSVFQGSGLAVWLPRFSVSMLFFCVFFFLINWLVVSLRASRCLCDTSRRPVWENNSNVIWALWARQTAVRQGASLSSSFILSHIFLFPSHTDQTDALSPCSPTFTFGEKLFRNDTIAHSNSHFMSDSIAYKKWPLICSTSHNSRKVEKVS